jgi:hypothetical protein
VDETAFKVLSQELMFGVEGNNRNPFVRREDAKGKIQSRDVSNMKQGATSMYRMYISPYLPPMFILSSLGLCSELLPPPFRTLDLILRGGSKLGVKFERNDPK